MREGWISIYRRIQKNWIWQIKEKFDKRSAWIDILLSVNHKDHKVFIDGSLLTVKRGQVLTSEVKLSKKWIWSRTAVRTFLKLLESDNMIQKIVYPNKFTIIQICNYDKYQNKTSIYDTKDIDKIMCGTREKEMKETDEIQLRNKYRTAKKQQLNTNNNKDNSSIKNKKTQINKNTNTYKASNENKVKYGDFVYLTEFEYESLIRKFGLDDSKKMILILDNYKGANDKKYKSDYRAILSWVVDKLNRDKRKDTINDSKIKNNKFCNYKQRKYDFKTLERKLLGWDKLS